MTAIFQKITHIISYAFDSTRASERGYPPITRAEIEATKDEVKPYFDTGRWVTRK